MWKKALFYSLTLIIFAGCKDKFVTKSFFSLGSIVEITLPEDRVEYFNKIQLEFKRFEDDIGIYTKLINDSAPKKEIKISEIMSKLLDKSEYYYNISNGKFDITIATITYLYGFPEGPFKIPEEQALKKAKSISKRQNYHKSGNNFIKYENIMLDTGGYATGFIVDQVSELMKKNGINDFIINASGDIYCSGKKNKRSWHIGIKHPDYEGKTISVVNLSDKALATSGNYERFFLYNNIKIVHIFDGITKESANNYKSVSVIAENTEKADALSTIYYLMSEKQIAELCIQLKTPVLVYTLDNKSKEFCGWKSYERD